MKLRSRTEQVAALSRYGHHHHPFERPASSRRFTSHSSRYDGPERHLEPLTTGISLLDLPTEVRLEILRYLVVFDRPLHSVVLSKTHRPRRSRNYGSALPILSTCKQLRLEGLPMFYRENTFDIVLYGHLGNSDPRMAVLGHDLGLCCEPPTVLSEMRKLKVTLRGWPREMDEDDTWEDRRMLHLLCEILTDFLDERPESVLGALSLLRNLKSAKVCGIDRSYAAQLEALMMKSGRIENIWKMRRALREWCEWWTGNRETDLDGDVPDAVYDSDIERFKLLRSDIIRGQQAENHPSVRDVFQYDLGPTQEHEALRAG